MKKFTTLTLLFLFLTVGNVFAGKISTRSTMPTECSVGDLWINPSGIAYNRIYTCTATNTWTLNAGSGGVTSVNGQTVVVVLDADDIDDTGTTNKFTTSTEKSTWNGKQDALGYTPQQRVTGTCTAGSSIREIASDGTVTCETDDTGSGSVPDGTVDGQVLLWVTDQWVASTFPGMLESGSYTPTGTWNWTSATVTWPTFNQSTTGSAASLSAQYIDWNASSGGSSIANKPTLFDPTSPGAIGGTTPAAGTFTTIAANTSITAPVFLTSAVDGERYSTLPNNTTPPDSADVVNGFYTYANELYGVENSGTASKVLFVNDIGVSGGAQGYDADLDTWSGITPGTGVGTALGNSLGSAGGVSTTIASGTTALGTSEISTGACATVVSSAGTNIATTDVIDWVFNADPSSTTGYNPSGDLLYIVAYPTAGYANFLVCNKSGNAITPGAVTLNWKVQR